MNRWVRSVSMRLEHALWTANKSHIQLIDESSLDRYDHTRHGLHQNPRGKRKLVQLIADRIRCKPDTGKIPVIIGARLRPFFFRITSKCRAKHLKDTTINKPLLNSEFSNNSLSVYHQNFRGLSNNTDELLVTVKNVHSPHILCLTEHHMKLPEIL
jgi:hypothetical protein